MTRGDGIECGSPRYNIESVIGVYCRIDYILEQEERKIQFSTEFVDQFLNRFTPLIVAYIFRQRVSIPVELQ